MYLREGTLVILKIWPQPIRPKMAAPVESCTGKETDPGAHFLLVWRSEAEEVVFLRSLITGEERWVRYFQPETKRDSKEWRHSSPPTSKKFRTHLLVGKLMLALFWDYKDSLQKLYITKGTAVNNEACGDLNGKHQKPAIRSKHRNLHSSGVLLHHDSARSRAAHAKAQ